MQDWLREAKIETAYIQWQNGLNESFNGRLRDECLSVEWFRNRVEARVVIEQWRRHYDQIRPHSSLDCRTPQEFRQHHTTVQPQRHFQVIE